MLTFPYLEAKPEIRIVQDESNENIEGHYNLTNIESTTDETINEENVNQEEKSRNDTPAPVHIDWEKIKMKILECENFREKERKQLREFLWTHRRVFQRESRLLTN